MKSLKEELVKTKLEKRKKLIQKEIDKKRFTFDNKEKKIKSLKKKIKIN